MTADELILAIETSNPGADVSENTPPHDTPGVCLARNGTVIAHAPLIARERHDDALLPAIDRVCTQAGVTPNDIDRVGVSIGPGGYTSIRIAVTVAKCIAEATGARCVPVPTALVVAHASAPDAAKALVALAWKREDVWVQEFEHDAPAGDARLIPIDELGTWDETYTIVCEPRLFSSPTSVAPVFSASCTARLARTIAAVDPIDLLPLYPREPEAVRKWAQLRADRGT